MDRLLTSIALVIALLIAQQAHSTVSPSASNPQPSQHSSIFR